MEKKPRPTDKPKDFIKDFFTDSKQNFEVRRKFKKATPESLNEKQSRVYNIVTQHAEWPLNPLRLICQGIAGTGKSHLILCLREFFERRNIKYSVCSFTGGSAFLVAGATFHYTFHIPMFGKPQTSINFSPAVKASLGRVSYWLFDEQSLIGLTMLGQLSQRMKAVYGNFDPLGGSNVILLGDFGQLNPVGDFKLYRSPVGLSVAGFDRSGYDAYHTFDKCIILTEQMRQNDPNQAKFRELLMRVRTASISEDDIRLLSSRSRDAISDEEWKLFERDAVFCYGERKFVEHKNEEMLQKAGAEIVEIPDQITKNAPAGLEPNVLRLCVGAKVRLTRNTWVEAGLFNGAQGTVTEIVRGPDGYVEHVFVRFHSYFGKPYPLRRDLPISRMPQAKHCSISGASWTCTQFPLEKSWACTVHRLQGSTLDRIVVGIPELAEGRNSMFFRESPAMIYTALSRVRRLEDIVLTSEFRPDLVSRNGNSFQQWQDALVDLEKMEARTNYTNIDQEDQELLDSMDVGN